MIIILMVAERHGCSRLVHIEMLLFVSKKSVHTFKQWNSIGWKPHADLSNVPLLLLFSLSHPFKITFPSSPHHRSLSLRLFSASCDSKSKRRVMITVCMGWGIVMSCVLNSCLVLPPSTGVGTKYLMLSYSTDVVEQSWTYLLLLLFHESKETQERIKSIRSRGRGEEEGNETRSACGSGKKRNMKSGHRDWFNRDVERRSGGREDERTNHGLRLLSLNYRQASWCVMSSSPENGQWPCIPKGKTWITWSSCLYGLWSVPSIPLSFLLSCIITFNSFSPSLTFPDTFDVSFSPFVPPHSFCTSCPILRSSRGSCVNIFLNGSCSPPAVMTFCFMSALSFHTFDPLFSHSSINGNNRSKDDGRERCLAVTWSSPENLKNTNVFGRLQNLSSFLKSHRPRSSERKDLIFKEKSEGHREKAAFK